MDSWRQQQEQEEQQQEEEHMAEQSIYRVINAVHSELAKTGISKDDVNSFDKYKFRGIDAVYNAVSPVLAKHGLLILQRVLSCATTERVSAKGGVLYLSVVEVEFDLVSSSDGSKHTIKTYGEGMDRGDKSVNKALTAAYKYAIFQAFCIPTESTDADAESHDTQQAKDTGDQQEKVMAAVKCLSNCANVEALEDVFVNITGGHAKQSEFYKACVNAAKNRKTQLLQEAV